MVLLYLSVLGAAVDALGVAVDVLEPTGPRTLRKPRAGRSRTPAPASWRRAKQDANNTATVIDVM
jgi:hypothetical protein